ncbi:MAG: hypothetical protein R2911_19165 [Caldilineaceae bacterium]
MGYVAGRDAMALRMRRMRHLLYYTATMRRWPGLYWTVRASTDLVHWRDSPHVC